MKKKFYVFILFAFAAQLAGCSKEQIEKKVEDMVVKVMVDGVWVVTKYMEDSTDLTSELLGWECQFYENRNCTAKKDGITIHGTWDGSYANQTMTGNFGNNPPLNKMNGVWQIKRSTLTTGQFERTGNGVFYRLEIQKK